MGFLWSTDNNRKAYPIIFQDGDQCREDFVGGIYAEANNKRNIVSSDFEYSRCKSYEVDDDNQVIEVPILESNGGFFNKLFGK